jgi:hypothetical protein
MAHGQGPDSPWAEVLETWGGSGLALTTRAVLMAAGAGALKWLVATGRLGRDGKLVNRINNERFKDKIKIFPINFSRLIFSKKIRLTFYD